MKHVTIITVPNALGSTVTIPLEMLSAANDIARARRQRDKIVTLDVVSVGEETVTLSGGLKIHCEKSISDVRKTDLIFVPGIWGNPRKTLNAYDGLYAWLRNQYNSNCTICSIVTGSYFDEFQNLFPKVRLQRKRFITSANNIFCTGSVNAARDIMLHFVQLLYGESIADEISHHFTHELKRSYESLLLSKDQQATHHDELIIKVQEWLQENYANNLHVSEVADNFKLSARSLNRRFKNATTTTPLQYLQELRIEQANELLKKSNLSVSEVADQVGYQDASYFTSLFKKLNSVTPNEYKSLVRNKLFVAESKPSISP